MSQWYHRNPLKSTAPIKFNLPLKSAQTSAIQICVALNKARSTIIELVPDPSSDATILDETIKTYLSLLQGFILCFHLDKDRQPTQTSRLRNLILFKWTNSVIGTTEKYNDSVFELISILYEYALWLMKHSTWIAAQDKIDMDSAKQVHNSLKRAAGIFNFIQTHWVGQMSEKIVPGSDLDINVINAYQLTCQAEAQEVTIARAIELKHNSSLISSLAHHTLVMFTKASTLIKSLKNKMFNKWLAYLELKAAVYESYAYCYLGESLLEQEKCGDAIRSLDESEKHFQRAKKLCREYSSIKEQVKNGLNAKIDEHLFFRNLRPLVERIKEKCLRENGFIFHQKVPIDCPPLESKATHGLVAPEEFTLPPLNELWNSEAYFAFDIAVDQKKINKEKETPIEEIKEKPIQTSHDQTNESGCSIQ
ncbi:hypothetical protein DERP_003915 [Dermatophagoides pteronyssinus]|uniref:BRO1 domain-containing protein BROX-like n=2 Tax=Dermatophagoides pteronyssinus TaxID=6956 RepID=A0A6P6XMK0_DERPT|nr:BRO1 domain-containing protein BROX-like [Dermatophagoides pteronyssinus]KAH9418590.1 hypothetical protein DERP_003915 [Dermatophagoides pteronyssinus]